MISFFKFLLDTCLFVWPLTPLFWTFGDVCPGFQSQSGSLSCKLRRRRWWYDLYFWTLILYQWLWLQLWWFRLLVMFFVVLWTFMGHYLWLNNIFAVVVNRAKWCFQYLSNWIAQWKLISWIFQIANCFLLANIFLKPTLNFRNNLNCKRCFSIGLLVLKKHLMVANIC